MTIYLPRQPTFMEQFLQTGALDNIMKSIMMGVQNRRTDEATARGYQEAGYQETIPMTPSQEAAAPQSPEERAAFESGPRGAFWQQRVPDVSVGGTGTFGAPKRGFRKPVEPKMTFGVEKGEKGQDWAIVRKGNNIVKVERIKPEKDKDTRSSLIKGYEYALQQHKDGVAKHPGSYTQWSRRQRRSSASRISIGEKVKEQTQKQIAKMQTNIRSPKFREDAKAFVMKQPDADLLEPSIVEVRTREEMDRRIRELYPNKKVTFERRKRKDGTEFLGWYVNGKLERVAE